MYVLGTDSSGRITSAHQEVEIKSAQLSYSATMASDQQVVEWAARLTPPVDLSAEYPPHASLFLDPNSLVFFCKFHGMMLHAKRGEGFTLGRIFNVGPVPWRQLRRAAAL